MPQLGESVHEGTISRWLVQPGETIVEFQPLLEVDTDKVSAEVPAPVSGVLREILASEGQTVQAGAPIAVVEVGIELAGPSGPGDPSLMSMTTSATGAPASNHAGRGVGLSPTEGATKPIGELTSVSEASSPAYADGTIANRPGHSVAVRKQASELNVDLSQVRGTGIGGRVTKKDVEQFATSTTVTRVPIEGDQVVPLTRVRRLIAENVSLSKATIPHAWQTQEVDMSGVAANRAANGSAFQVQEGFSLTYLPYVMAATVGALREHPQVNSTFDDARLIVHRQINLGISVVLQDAVVVPVVRRADGLSLTGLARAVNELASRARDDQLTADDLVGATFTVNNSDTFGTLFSYSVINLGQVGVLTMGAVVERPVAVNGMIQVRPMMYLCFSLDHRAMDGLGAARFLTSCRKRLEEITATTPIF